MIKIEHLYKTYNPGKKNEEKVLKDVSLEFDRTGLVCLLGESGSGKTTLLNAIGGLDTFSGGTITIDQTTLKGYNPKVMEPLRNDRFDYIFVLIKKGERRFCSASVNTDVKAHSPFSSSLKNSSQISSALYLLRLAGALSIHMPFVKSGTGTGMLPIAIDCSERQVIAIHVAAS